MVDQAFIKNHGFSHKDTENFSEEEREAYKKSQEEITAKAKAGRMEKEEEIGKKKLGKKKAKLSRRSYDHVDRFAKRVGHSVRTVFFSLLLLVVGVAISTAIGNMWFMVGFLFWSFYTILPDPGETKIVENVFKDDEDVPDEDKKLRFKAGSLLATKENRTNTGLAFMKAVMRVGIIICFIGGLYTQPFPLSNLILLFLAFGFYFTMPVEFEPRKPYDFILSFFRVLLGVFIAVFIFGAFGGGIFQSRELGWLTMAFFVVFPVATERESLARALGRLGSGTGQSYEMLDKIIFLFIMLMFIGGSALTGGFGFVGGLFSGTGGIIFSAVWVLGLVAGLTTPAETRPWMGVIILIVGFTVFGLGAGQQAMGVAFFGEWWPNIHNAVTEFMEPIGDMFSQFQQTFGQTWLLFTSPTEFAKQITQGTYAKNELGVTGAYGLEVRGFDVQSIYIDEPFVIQIELENKGIYHAKNVKVELLTNIRDFRIAKDVVSLEHDISKMKAIPKVDKYGKTWYKFTIDRINSPEYNLDDIERQDALPIFLVGMMNCEDFNRSAWRDFGSLGGHEHTVREYFIPFVVNVTYEYEAESNLQVDFISTDEWKRLSSEDKLVRGQVPSVISTAPASLNLGSMDQPIKEDSPFFVGFNLTTTWPQKTLISGGTVNLYLPEDFGVRPVCTGTPDLPSCKRMDLAEKVYNCTFNLKGHSKSAFCSYTKLEEQPIKVPKKTYTISADAVYTFSRWESKDTLFNFKDVCWPREGGGEVTPFIEPTEVGGEKYCEYKIAQGHGKCDVGEGGCQKGMVECIEKQGGPNSSELICGDVQGIINPICCYEDLLQKNQEECEEAYDEWINRIISS